MFGLNLKIVLYILSLAATKLPQHLNLISNGDSVSESRWLFK